MTEKERDNRQHGREQDMEKEKIGKYKRKKNKTWNDAAAVSGSDTGNGESGVQMGNRSFP